MKQLEDRDLESRLNLVVGWIKHADTKAAATLSGATAISAVAAGQLAKTLPIARTSFVLAMVAAGVAGYWAWTALVPRTLPHEERTRSLLFFASIAQRESARDLLADLRQQSDEDELLDYAHQVRELSVIAKAKFDRVDSAINSVAGSAVLLAIAFALRAWAL